MMTLSLALRNLLRNRRRSLATLLAMAIGSAAILAVWRLQRQHQLHNAHQNTCKRGGHLQIQHRDFYLYGSGNPTRLWHRRLRTNIERHSERRGVAQTWCWWPRPPCSLVALPATTRPACRARSLAPALLPKTSTACDAGTTSICAPGRPCPRWQARRCDAAMVGTGVARVLQLCDALKIERCPKPEEPASS